MTKFAKPSEALRVIFAQVLKKSFDIECFEKVGIKLFSIILLLFISASSFAQSSTKVSVVDSAQQTVLPYAHISFASIDAEGKKKVVNTITDENGSAEVPFLGTTSVTVMYMGYGEKTINVSGGGDVTIQLASQDNVLPTTVVTGSFLPTAVEQSVFNVKVIDKVKIESLGANNLQALLTNELNIRQQQDQFLGSSMSMQGVDGENVKILIDGVPVIGRFNGGIDLSQINLNNIEKIEIVQGPASVNYGTNALGGVINLITKSSQASLIEGSVNTYYESVGTYNADALVGINIKKHFLQLSGGKYYFNGFGDRGHRSYDWDPKDQSFGEIQYAYRIKDLRLRFRGAYYHDKITDRGEPLTTTNVAQDRYYRTNRTSTSLFLTGYIKNKHYIDITASYSNFRRRKNTMLKDMSTLEEWLNSDVTSHDTTVFNSFLFRGSYTSNRPNKKVNYLAGYDINLEQNNGERIESGEKSIYDFAGFVNLDYAPAKWAHFKAGLRYAYNTQFGAPVTPSINALFNITPTVQIRASYARGFRAPSLKELYLDFVDINHNITGNGSLEAERSNNYHLNLSYSPKLKDVTLSIKPGVFYNQIFDQIANILVDASTQAFTYENVDQFESLGGQLEAELGWKNFSWSIGTSVTGVRSDQFDAPTVSNEFLLSPELRANFTQQIPAWKMSWSIFYKYTGRTLNYYQDQTDGSVKQGELGSFHTLDVSVSKQLFKEKLTLSLYGKNLAGVTNVINTGGNAIHSTGGDQLVAWGRSIAVALRFNFKANKRE